VSHPRPGQASVHGAGIGTKAKWWFTDCQEDTEAQSELGTEGWAGGLACDLTRFGKAPGNGGSCALGKIRIVAKISRVRLSESRVLPGC